MPDVGRRRRPSGIPGPTQYREPPFDEPVERAATRSMSQTRDCIERQPNEGPTSKGRQEKRDRKIGRTQFPCSDGAGKRHETSSSEPPWVSDHDPARSPGRRDRYTNDLKPVVELPVANLSRGVRWPRHDGDAVTSRHERGCLAEDALIASAVVVDEHDDPRHGQVPLIRLIEWIVEVMCLVTRVMTVYIVQPSGVTLLPRA